MSTFDAISMMRSIAGLTPDDVRTTIVTLNYINESDVAKLYVNTIELYSYILKTVTDKLFAIRKDILFWNRLSRSSSWNIALHGINSLMFEGLFPSQSSNSFIIQDEAEMVQYCEYLQTNFDTLLIVFREIVEGAGPLNKIISVVSASQTFSPRSPKYDSNNETDEFEVTFEEKKVTDKVLLDIRKSLLSLINTVKTHIPDSDLTTAAFELTLDEDYQIDDALAINLRIKDVFQNLDNYSIAWSQKTTLENRENSEDWINLVAKNIKRPSNSERFWIRNLMLSAIGAYSTYLIIKWTRNGKMEIWIKWVSDFITSKTQEHVIQPVKALIQELFDTIRKREYIVRREDLEESQAVLYRMLEDFSKSKRGSYLIMNLPSNFPGLSVGGFFAQQKDHQPDNNTSSNIANTTKTAVEATKAITIEHAMTALMTEYERELQSPLRGIAFGSLMTAILIQMQKLKVHTEAAMLTMDQILKSNELTMSATAAMPAFALLGTSLFLLRNALKPRVDRTRRDTSLRFRLILSDVDRCLEEIILIKNQQEQGVPNLSNDLSLATGRYYFNVVRLRSEFNTLFEKNFFSTPILPRKMSSKRTTSVASLSQFLNNFGFRMPEALNQRLETDLSPRIEPTPRGYKLYRAYTRDNLESLSIDWDKDSLQDYLKYSSVKKCFNSAFELLKAIYTVIFGENELKSETTQYQSINKDILLLENPNSEIPVETKLVVAKRMRISYRSLYAGK